MNKVSADGGPIGKGRALSGKPIARRVGQVPIVLVSGPQVRTSAVVQGVAHFVHVLTLARCFASCCGIGVLKGNERYQNMNKVSADGGPIFKGRPFSGKLVVARLGKLPIVFKSGSR